MPRVLLSCRAGGRRVSTARRNPSLLVLLAVVMPWALACASSEPALAYTSTREVLAGLDEFGALLVKAGLPPELLPTGRDVSAEQARQLRLHFHFYQPKASEYAPWLVADMLLLEVTRKEATVSRSELDRRIQEFRPLLVLRPDGYLAEALSGRAERCVGPVVQHPAGYRAGVYEVGHFYKPEAGGEPQPVTLPEPTSESR